MMGIHFSQGGLTLKSSSSIHFNKGFSLGFKGLIPTVCATHTYVERLEVTLVWKGDCVEGSCNCVENTVFCIPRGDYRRIVVSIVNQNGDAIDISGWTSYEYVIAATVDDAPVVTKTLGSGIQLGGDNSSIVIELRENDTKLIPRDYSYHELRLTNGISGQTVMSGFIRATDTILGND